MIIKMRKEASRTELGELIDRIRGFGHEVDVSTGTERVVIGIKGDTTKISIDEVLGMAGVEDVVRMSKPYKLVSQEYNMSMNGGGKYSTIDVSGVKIGDGSLTIMAGPCAVESEEQINASAEIVKQAGANLLRGGAFKPRTGPYSWRGLGEEGLRLLAEAREKYAIPVVSEITSESQLELFKKYGIDMLQVGSRNGRNYDLLDLLGKQEIPVLLKREMGTPVEEYLQCAERIVTTGNSNVVLCERGINSFDKYCRNCHDVNAISAIKYELSNLPVMSDPSHATGKRRLVLPAALAAVGAGADGLIIEMHPTPEKARTDAFQQVNQPELENIISLSRGTYNYLRQHM